MMSIVLYTLVGTHHHNPPASPQPTHLPYPLAHPQYPPPPTGYSTWILDLSPWVLYNITKNYKEDCQESRPIPPLPPCLISPSICFSLLTRYSYLRVYFALNFGDGVKYWAIDHYRPNQSTDLSVPSGFPFHHAYQSPHCQIYLNICLPVILPTISNCRLAKRPPGRKQQDSTLSFCLCLCLYLYRCWCLQPPLSFFLPFPVPFPAPVPFHLLFRFHCSAPNFARFFNTTLKRHISQLGFEQENSVWIGGGIRSLVVC